MLNLEVEYHPRGRMDAWEPKEGMERGGLGKGDSEGRREKTVGGRGGHSNVKVARTSDTNP